MNDFIKMLDEKLDYVSHNIIGGQIFVTVESNCQEPFACRRLLIFCDIHLYTRL